MDDLFKRTMTDIDMYSKVLKSLAERAIQLGLAPKDVTVQRAHLKVDGAVNKFMKHEETANQLGYSSVAHALKALSQVKDRVTHGVEVLPETLQKVPNIWLTGKPEGKRTKGFVGLTLSKALRRHRVMVPLILEVWELIGQDEELREQVVYNYLRMSADDFEKELYRYIYELEEVTLEEEFEGVVSDTFEDIVDTYNYMFDPRRIYDVTSEPMPTVNHDDE